MRESKEKALWNSFERLSKNMKQRNFSKQLFSNEKFQDSLMINENFMSSSGEHPAPTYYSTDAHDSLSPPRW